MDDNLADFPLTVFNALGDLHLFFAVEQRHRAHLPQIHLHRIDDAGHLRLVAFIQGLAVDIFRRQPPAFRVRKGPFPVKIIHVHAVKQHHQVINLLRWNIAGWKHLMHIATMCRLLSSDRIFRPAGTVTGMLLHHARFLPLTYGVTLHRASCNPCLSTSGIHRKGHLKHGHSPFPNLKT